jgi:ABC-type nitrate/sulfonate/bicarbonate transport system substrate-binding protein
MQALLRAALVAVLICGVLAVQAGTFSARPAAAAGAPDVIRVETSDYDLSAEPSYGVAAGIFARHGITLEIQSAIEGGANMVRDVAAGNADVGFSNLISIAGAIQAGAPIILIAPAGLYDRKSPPNAIVVGPNSAIKTAQDLNGKNISSPSGPGSAGALAPAAWIDQHGGDSKTVHFVTGIKPMDLPAALASGAVAAGEVGDPQLTMLLQLGTVRMFASPFDAEGDHYLLAGFVASKAWVSAHPDVAHRFVAAMTETAHWANTHRAETGAILAAHLKLTPPVMAAMSRTFYAETLTPETIAPPLAAAVKYGIIKPMTASELLAASAF